MVKDALIELVIRPTPMFSKYKMFLYAQSDITFNDINLVRDELLQQYETSSGLTIGTIINSTKQAIWYYNLPFHQVFRNIKLTVVPIGTSDITPEFLQTMDIDYVAPPELSFCCLRYREDEIIYPKGTLFECTISSSMDAPIFTDNEIRFAKTCLQKIALTFVFSDYKHITYCNPDDPDDPMNRLDKN